MLQQRYPDATFEVAPGEDNPEGVHLIATVDVEDTDQVLDLVMDRVLELQIEAGLPVHVIPEQPLTRVLDEMRRPRSRITPRIELETIAPLTRS